MRARWLFGLVLGTMTSSAFAAGHRPGSRARRSLAEHDAEHASAPSYRYANREKGAGFAELDARHVEYVKLDEAPGVLAPVRIPNGVGGVRYHTGIPAAERATSPWEVFDCRLVLALDDFSKILTAHGYVEAITFSGWRPPGKHWPKDRLATRHPGGLAVDIKALRKPDATDETATLDVTADYHGEIGKPSCGPNAQEPTPPSARATELRAIYCEAVAARLFTSMLSPNHDRPHHNHFHLEVTPSVTWRLIR